MKNLSSRINRLERISKGSELVTTWAELVTNATNGRELSLSPQLTELLNHLEE